MNTKTIITLGALVAGVLLTAAALPPAWADALRGEGQSPAALEEQRAHLWQMRDIMHNAAFAAETRADGVTVKITSPNGALVEAIRHEFTEQHALQSPVAGSTVSTAEIEGGIALSFVAEDAAVVETLQGYGAGLGYTLLRNNMHEAMWSAGGPGATGPGMMGSGYGPQGQRPQGWGPGAMGPGMMGSGYGPQGRGMMGGWGGWGHGPGMMGGWGYGPQWQSEGNN